MTRGSGRWFQETRRDPYKKLSKAFGYRSRAAFKLKQLISKFDILKKGDVIIDLGCYPGGWLQVASEHVGDEGFVLGVDRKPVEPMVKPNVLSIVLDVEEEHALEKIKDKMPRDADVVLSDLAPEMTGVYQVDHFRQISLTRIALNIAKGTLKPGGIMVVKVFEGDMLKNLERDILRHFTYFRRFKPRASRKRSSELYLICFGFKAERSF
ncbi:MAG: RlmE family RNA methyltransferase [Thermoproteota archaeon]